MSKPSLHKRITHAFRVCGRWVVCLLLTLQPEWLKTRARLQNERDAAMRQTRIWEAVAGEDDFKLRAEFQHGECLAEMNGKIKGIRVLCAEARGLLKHAPNYVECSMRDDLGELLLIIQKREGKTPHELRRAAEAERDELRARLALQGETTR
jgi:hypothetical protein